MNICKNASLDCNNYFFTHQIWLSSQRDYKRKEKKIKQAQVEVFHTQLTLDGI